MRVEERKLGSMNNIETTSPQTQFGKALGRHDECNGDFATVSL
jgi:hypothetical protein